MEHVRFCEAESFVYESFGSHKGVRHAEKRGRVRLQQQEEEEVRKAPRPVGAVRLFEGRSDDGETYRKQKKTHGSGRVRGIAGEL